MSGVKIAEDRYKNKMQFAHLNSEDAQTITAAVVFNANYDQHVRIKPTVGDAWVQTGTLTALTPAVGEGTFIDNELSVIIRKGTYIGASAEINVTPWGE